MKKVIFDIDNTLIFWKDEYIFALKEVLSKYNIYDEKTINLIDYLITQYEYDNETLSKEELLNYLNRNANLNLSIDFMDALIESQKMCYEKPESSLIETLEYLSKKYELVVLSNWFTDTQVGRLKNMNLLKYFKEVHGGEGYLKPNTKAFDKVLGNNLPNECVYVGDSLKIDIEGALNRGLNAVLYNYKKNEINDERFKVITDLTSLKDIL